MQAAKLGPDIGLQLNGVCGVAINMTQDAQPIGSGKMEVTPKVETPKELVFDRLDRLDGLKACVPQFFATEKPPEWVFKVLVQLLKVYLPGVKINKETKNTPFVMGALMGHQAGMAKFMTPEKMTSLNRFIHAPETKPWIAPEKCKADKQGVETYNATVPTVAQVAKEAAAGALNLPNEDLAEFMRGFQVGTKAATIESFRAHREFTTAVYIRLFCGWQEVEKLESITALRNWLLQRMPEIDVGGEDRIKKLCGRIGLKLRDRGRPRKAGK